MNFDNYLPYAFALILVIPFLVLARQFVFYFIKSKDRELQILGLKSNSENKLQAYERMTLFLERIKPSTLVMKFDSNLKPHEFIFLTEKNIQEEFEYNSSQQLYLTRNTWSSIVAAKTNTIQLLHKTFEEMQNVENLQDYKTVLLMKYVESEDYISDIINEMRKEITLLN